MADKKLWGGRFSSGTDSNVEEYTESISFDNIMYKQDIAGSKAHAAMLAKQGVLTLEEGQALRNGLDEVEKEIAENRFDWKKEREDVHMNIEARLTELVGDVGKKLHTARSRNDQVALDFRLFVSDSLRNWKNLLANLVEVLTKVAEDNRYDLLPGFTHLQPAQPISLAQHFLAYAFMFKRDYARVCQAEERARICPLGAGAIAGTTYPIDPSQVAQELGMYGVFDNSMDAVSDRDFVLEALFCASVSMMHLSRLCEELIIWANPAFGYVFLPDGYATGSSMMPQKKNPDVAEIMRGKVGRVYGDLFALLTIMKGLPLTYNRDLQEDKEPFFDANKTVSKSLAIMADMLKALEFNKPRMKQALAVGFLNATELADYLVVKGMAFREAHHVTGSAVGLAEKKGVSLEELSLDEFKQLSDLITEDVYEVLDYAKAVERRNSNGGTGQESISKQLATLQAWVKECM